MHEQSYYKWKFIFKKEPLIVTELKEACDILLKFEFGRQHNPTRSANAERHKSINKRSRVLNATLWLLDRF